MEKWHVYTKNGWRWLRHFAILTLNNTKWTCHEMFWCPWRRFCELSTIMCKQWERICINWPFLVIVIENWYMCTKYGWRWVQNFAILTLNNAKWTCHEVFGSRWRRFCELSTIMCKQWERIRMILAFPRYCHGELVYVHKIWLAVSTTLCHCDTKQCKLDLSWNVLVPMATIVWVINDYV